MDAPRPRVVVTLCWILGAVLVVVNLRLVAANSALGSQVDAFYRSIALPRGASLPPLQGFERDGDTIIVDSTEEDRPVLLLVFSPACPVCDENWPSWQRLVDRQRAEGGRVLLIDITGSVRDDYLAAYGVSDISVVDSLSLESAMSYRFRFTPETILVQGGRLAAGWMGLLTEQNVLEADSILVGV